MRHCALHGIGISIAQKTVAVLSHDPKRTVALSQNGLLGANFDVCCATAQ
jgi:hypothetical protein